MPTVTKFPAANQAAGGVFNGSWTNPSSAHADDGVYATAAPGKNQEFASVWQVAFASGDIPDGLTINSATVEVQWRVSTTASIATLRSTLFADSAQATALSASPGVNRTSEPTTDTIDSYSASTVPSLAQLRSGVWVRAQALRGNTNTAFTASLDYVKVTVNYTDPPPAITGSGGISAAASALAASGKERFAGSGAFAAPASTVASSGKQAFRGSGAVAALASQVAGMGDVPFSGHTGTGAIASSPSQVAATGKLRFAGSGGVTAAASTIAGGEPPPAPPPDTDGYVMRSFILRLGG